VSVVVWVGVGVLSRPRGRPWHRGRYLNARVGPGPPPPPCVQVGSCLFTFAPGAAIVSAGYSGDQAEATMSGTSMAAPAVAGVVALWLQYQPGVGPGWAAFLCPLLLVLGGGLVLSSPFLPVVFWFLAAGCGCLAVGSEDRGHLPPTSILHCAKFRFNCALRRQGLRQGEGRGGRAAFFRLCLPQ
jgi:hypothetical protein